jgi:myo-inositol-1-phosphate synthase
MEKVKTHSYTERMNIVEEGKIVQKLIKHEISVDTNIPKLGVMLVGWGGNNGTTFTAGIIANKRNLSWKTKTGTKKANYYGSMTQCVTTKVGMEIDPETNEVKDVYKVIKDMIPLVDPNHLEITGWDISDLNLYESCYRAQVLEPTLIDQLKDDLEKLVPMKAVFNPNYIASNQSDRVTNIFTGTNKECIEKLRKDISEFKKTVDKVIILWTANTEKNFEDIPTADKLNRYVEENVPLPGSVLYAYASAMEGVTFLNGSPQNTVSEGMIELFKERKTFIGGSDFKTGQTKFKSIMADFFMGTGLRLASCMSYNHLGNNDGKNLNEPETFRSKELSKRGVLQDSVDSNPVLYPPENNHIDHTIVIKYCPFVGDSKRALDEYTSEIFMNGLFTLVSHATCEDSLLATPIMIDLVILAEFFTRIKINNKTIGPVLSYLSLFFKAPITNHPEYVFNSFARQKTTLINFLKACADIPEDDSTLINIRF